MHYVPLTWPFFVALIFLFAFLVMMIEIGILQYAFASMGVDQRYMFTLLVFSLLGSYINIPVAVLPAGRMHSGEVVDFFGVEYIIPLVVPTPQTVIAVNVGGAVVPVIVSLYLMKKNRLYGSSLLAVAIVSLLVRAMAQPVPGVGIAVPIFAPPVITAVVALLISRPYAAPLAYIAGSLGTLIGADLMNLGKVRGLGAPVASIGGAGKFDGIFLTGILAVLLAGILGRLRLEPHDREWPY
jgi:uncharacterized membrane protein